MRLATHAGDRRRAEINRARTGNLELADRGHNIDARATSCVCIFERGGTGGGDSSAGDMAR
jgi:hypothetical protein